jgi:hypothetical protein
MQQSVNMLPQQQIPHATIEELLDAVFSMQSLPRLYNQPTWESCETVTSR